MVGPSVRLYFPERLCETQGFDYLGLATAWGTMLIFDSGIFGLTFWKAVETGRRGNTLRIMLRDGTRGHLYVSELILNCMFRNRVFWVSRVCPCRCERSPFNCLIEF